MIPKKRKAIKKDCTGCKYLVYWNDGSVCCLNHGEHTCGDDRPNYKKEGVEE